MKKIINNISIFAVLVLTIASCSDFLDREPTDYATKGFYKSEEAIRDGAAGVYNLVYSQDLGSWGYNVPFTVYSDHFTAFALERNENTTIGAGTINPDLAQVTNFWNRLYVWLARANGVIDGSKDYVEGLSDLAKQYEAEVRVLRAFIYYYLISTWGDVPFFTAPVTVDQYQDARTDRTVILDFILDDLEFAAPRLPWMATERGRVDRAVAYGLKARAALLGGSLNYGGKGSTYFATAAEAAKKVIDSRERVLADDFNDLFYVTGQEKANSRSELLFEMMYSSVGGSIMGHAIGFGQGSRNTVQTGRHPSMLLADTYECIDGKRIDESIVYDPQHPSKNRDPRFYATLWMHGDSVTLNNGTIVTQKIDAYNNQTEFYDYTTNAWYTRDNFDVNSSVHPAAWASFCNAGVGLLWAKFTNETAEVLSGTGQSCNIPILRYAEVLLTYAEAKIELNQLDQTVYDAINAVRVRAGMPVVSTDRIDNQQKMMQLVRRERKVEFALEGLYFVDQRRWDIGDLVCGQPSYGHPFPWLAQAKLWMQANHPEVDVTGMTTQQLNAKLVELDIRASDIPVTDGYTLVTPDMVPNFNKTSRHDLNDIADYDAYKDKLHVRDLNRHWETAYNLWPIPQIERQRNPNLTQNSGYN